MEDPCTYYSFGDEQYHYLEYQRLTKVYVIARTLSIVSPLIFLLYLAGINLYLLLVIFPFVYLHLRIKYVKALNNRRFHFRIYTQFRNDKREAVQSLYGKESG
jgi:hypothetical protein